MIAAAFALALQSAAPPPPLVGDYFPGPWFLPVEGPDDRLHADAPRIFALVGDAARRVPITVDLCVERRDASTPAMRDRRLLAQVRSRLMAMRVKVVRGMVTRCPPADPPRSVDGVMIHPVP